MPLKKKYTNDLFVIDEFTGKVSGEYNKSYEFIAFSLGVFRNKFAQLVWKTFTVPGDHAEVEGDFEGETLWVDEWRNVFRTELWVSLPVPPPLNAHMAKEIIDAIDKRVKEIQKYKYPQKESGNMEAMLSSRKLAFLKLQGVYLDYILTHQRSYKKYLQMRTDIESRKNDKRNMPGSFLWNSKYAGGRDFNTFNSLIPQVKPEPFYYAGDKRFLDGVLGDAKPIDISKSLKELVKNFDEKFMEE